jgi:hypothetical protein
MFGKFQTSQLGLLEFEQKIHISLALEALPQVRLGYIPQVRPDCISQVRTTEQYHHPCIYRFFTFENL